MWKVRTKTVPAVIGALGKIKKGLDQNLKVAPTSPVGHRVTEDHTNEHRMHYL
jgi:hypothetical protein